MAMTLDDLRGLLDEEGLKYYLASDKPAIMANFGGLFGRYQVLMVLELDNTFLQFRTIGYLNCEVGHDSLAEVLKVVGALNYRTRLVKWGWDPSDGEIVAYADAWLVDNKLTLQQIRRMIGNYVSAVDMAYKRLEETIETGEDPGEIDPQALIADAMQKKGSGLPPAMKKLLDKLGRGGDKDDDEPTKIKTL
jgi:hypothetical protein